MLPAALVRLWDFEIGFVFSNPALPARRDSSCLGFSI
jgi:hypothetical protein